MLGIVNATVYRDGTRCDTKYFGGLIYQIFKSPNSTAKKLVKANEWADELIEVLKKNEA